MKYTQIPVNTFEEIQLNAGIIVDNFNPDTGVIGNLLGATTGGVAFADAVEYTDFGEDIDNCPKNMLELKKLDSHEVTMSGTFVTISADTAKTLSAAADIDESNAAHVIPRNEILTTDFTEIWWIGDYSSVNTGESAGFIAIHLMNALNTGGFQIQSGDKAKGQFAFSFMGHYSMAAQDRVPYELYIVKGGKHGLAGIVLNKHSTTIDAGSTETLTVTTVPAGQTVTWTTADSDVASIANGVITAVAAGSTIITAEITVDEVKYTDTCTVIVVKAEG